MQIPDWVLFKNLFGTAFSLARQLRFGIKNEHLANDLDHLRQESVDQCAKRCFSADNRAIVIVGP